mgnify:CR=1 FL=1
MKQIKNIIFDLGGVLIDWNPEYMYRKLISDEEKMLEINNIIEKWIKENPENWFWQHKRFN